MPANAAMKRKVRDRMKVTGEKYTTALRAVQAEPAASRSAQDLIPTAEPRNSDD